MWAEYCVFLSLKLFKTNPANDKRSSLVGQLQTFSPAWHLPDLQRAAAVSPLAPLPSTFLVFGVTFLGHGAAAARGGGGGCRGHRWCTLPPGPSLLRPRLAPSLPRRSKRGRSFPWARYSAAWRKSAAFCGVRCGVRVCVCVRVCLSPCSIDRPTSLT